MLVPFTLVNDEGGLRAMVEALAHVPRIAVDTESNGFHAYRPRVCLVQVSDGKREWAVDMLAPINPAPLFALLCDRSVTKILHAAEGDILGLRRDHRTGIAPVFDTMLAARATGIRRYGLADLLAERFQVTLDKRYQRHDWALRPLDQPALEYAVADVRHLFALADSLHAELAQLNRLGETQEDFERITRVLPEERPFDADGFWRLRGARDVPKPARAGLRELYVMRDRLARDQNRPPVKVMSDDVLLSLAVQRPADSGGLRRSGMSPYQIERYAAAVFASLRRASTLPPPDLPKGGPPPDPRIIARFDALKACRKRLAEARNVEPDVIVSNAALRALAHAGSRGPDEVIKVADLGPHKAAAFAAALAEALTQDGAEGGA